MSSRDSDAFAGTFHAPPDRVGWLSDVICGALPDLSAPVRVLDIGCGTGDQLFDLAARLPGAQLAGVDLAPANIAAAHRRQKAHPDGERIRFELADYRSFRPTRPFDVLMSYSVLQFVPGGVELLASRIAEDAAAGALLFNVMPYRCAYNSALAVVRRIMRAGRGPITDRALLRLARVAHGASLDAALIAERIDYAYAVPLQLDDDLADALGAYNFVTERREPIAHASPAQLKHVLRVMRKR